MSRIIDNRLEDFLPQGIAPFHRLDIDERADDEEEEVWARDWAFHNFITCMMKPNDSAIDSYSCNKL